MFRESDGFEVVLKDLNLDEKEQEHIGQSILAVNSKESQILDASKKKQRLALSGTASKASASVISELKEATREKDVPTGTSVSSIENVLVQALQTLDKASIDACLQTLDSRVVSITMSRLPAHLSLVCFLCCCDLT